ncbi:MAG: lamin tail domain-containing protein [Deltaproteobacteria bacterium]|nr:lamin tail domain-containing protein [Deltaproteobacteria bacterium]
MPKVLEPAPLPTARSAAPLAFAWMAAWALLAAGCDSGAAAAPDTGGYTYPGFDVTIGPGDSQGGDAGKDGAPETSAEDTSATDVADGSGDDTDGPDSGDGKGDASDAGDTKSETVSTDPCSPNPCSEPNKTLCTKVAGKAQCNCNIGYELQTDGTCAEKCTPPKTPPTPQKSLKAGDLVITEIMVWPLAVKDDAGEWFEVKNNSTKDIDMNGLTMTDDTGTDKHVINGCPGKMTLKPGEYRVLGRNGNKATNGGNVYDYVYASTSFNNLKDTLLIRADYAVPSVIDKVAWTQSWPLIDWKGAALNLDVTMTTATGNDDWKGFCASPNKLPSGDYGTPGAANPACPAPPDLDSDGVPDALDDCPAAFDPPGPDGVQLDSDGDGKGDACDNCAAEPNPQQENADGDAKGDACDLAVCGDGELDLGETCDDGNDYLGDGCDACAVGVALVGNLVINEIVAHGDNVEDATGQWFELYNPTGAPVPIKGWQLQVKNGVAGKPKVHAISDAVTVPAKGFVVLAANSNKALNGNITAQYAFNKPGAEFMLDPNGDTLTIVDVPGKKIVDSVAFGLNTPPVKTNVALQLDPKYANTLQNDTAVYWCYSSAPIAGVSGNFGSPGQNNPSCTPAGEDQDGDTVLNEVDNCPFVANGTQVDSDADKVGDACDVCQKVANPKQVDSDADGVGDLCDNCLNTPNPTQGDSDGDGFGDGCDSPTCGNGLVEAAEACDDSNTAGGDGCSLNCQKESYAAGQVLITEIMANPKAPIEDANGEWVELYNPGELPVDINGWVLRDNGTNKVVLTSTKPLWIAPGGYFVVGASTDKALNGGVTVQIAWAPGQFSLGNITGDDAILEWNGTKIDGVTYIPKPPACYTPPPPSTCATQFPVVEGKSMQLDPGAYDLTKNDDGKNWCEGKEPFTSGDFGSPGQANPPCVNPCEGQADNAPCGTDLICVGGQCKPAPKCGDGLITGAIGEECDDGNQTDGDGCSAQCKKEAPPQPKGTLVITEVMVDPDAVSDSKGEWFEVYNPTTEAIDLTGWKLVSDTTTHTITVGGPNVPNPPVVAAKQFALILAAADPAANNNLKPAYGWADQAATGGSLALKNVHLDWKLQLVNPAGAVIDEVNAGKLPWGVGNSAMVQPACLTPADNDKPECWVAAGTTCGYGLYMGASTYAVDPPVCSAPSDCAAPTVCQPMTAVQDGSKTMWKYDLQAPQSRCGARDRGTPGYGNMCP